MDPEKIEDARRRARALEEACDFNGAALAALEGSDPASGARLAALARASDTFAAASDALAEQGQGALERVGADLAARGMHDFAAELFERSGAFAAAGDAFAKAGEPARAAGAFERAGRPADGARALERAIASDPLADALRRTLAELLLRHGRVEAAVKVLQKMNDGDERDGALPLLARSLRALGLAEAAAEVDREMEERGLAHPSEPPTSNRISRPPTSASKPPDTGPHRAAPSILFGRFEVVREVRKTPHAHLFEATDRVIARRVAVKILAASTRGAGRDAFLRFEREARALQQLRHPTIVDLCEFIPDGPAMVLEWMNGGSLADLMQRETFAPARAIEIAAAILTALGQAHRLGILHRDVKPSNVLFDDVGTPKLSDFGAAHLGDLSTTVTAGAIGTFSYMSPEQRLGRAASVQSDIYAVGALLYEMITGVPAEPLKDASGFFERPPSAYHMDLDDHHDRSIAAFLQEDAAARPVDTFEAKKLIEGLRWPTRSLPRQGPASNRPSVQPPATNEARLAPPRGRYDPRDEGRIFFDTVAERNVIVLPLDEASIARFRPWAKVMHPALATVLRASTADGQLWVEAPRGRCLVDIGGGLGPSALGEVREALTTLHRLGGVHGALDREHIYLGDEGVFIACARDWERPVTSIDDLRALESLGRRDPF